MMPSRQPVHLPVLGITGGRENRPTPTQIRALCQLTGLRVAVQRGKDGVPPLARLPPPFSGDLLPIFLAFL